MERKELIDILRKHNRKNIVLCLNGIIATDILIENIQIIQKKNYLIIENRKNRKIKIGLNLRQLMKIRKTKINELELQFDQLQQVIISLKH